MTTTERRDYNTNLPGNACYEKLPPRDSAHYELRDIEDFPVGGHQEQVLIVEEEE